MLNSVPQDKLIVGKIAGLYGIRGWVKVYSYTQPVTNILTYSPWQLSHSGDWQIVQVAEGQAYGKGVIARLENCQDRTSAAQWLGATIAIDRAQLPPALEGEYYWADLIGLTVINTEGITFGQVVSLLETGANDVLVIQGEGQRERLIPFLPDRVILAIDLTEGWIRVDWGSDY